MHLIRPGAMLTLLGLAVSSREVMGQEAAPAPGDRVRVEVCERTTGASCRFIVGSFVSWTPDRIVLRDSMGAEHGIAAGQRSKLEVSRGKYSPFGRGLLYGFLGGTGLGGVMALACTKDAGEDAGMCAGWLPLAAGVGTAVGGLVGAVSTSERWTSVRRPQGFTVRPSGRGVRIGFAQTF